MPDDHRRPGSSEEESASTPGSAPVETDSPAHEPDPLPEPRPYTSPADADVRYDDPYGYDPEHTSPYAPEPVSHPGAANPPSPLARSSEPPDPPPPTTDVDTEDEDDEGMLRMSFLEHLEELRKRILYALAGLGVAFLASLTFSDQLWRVVQEPAAVALAKLGYKDATLIYTNPMEGFSIIWVKLPLLVGIFLASPWLLYQVWAFVAPGLYKKERRFAVPFVICSAGLFVLGGLFAYFVAFRLGLVFLLGIGRDVGVRPMISITDYFDIFVNVVLGIGVVFELPILIFFLTLLRIASPRFLVANARYAVLGIVVLAAIVTPTADVLNLMLFSVPMVLLYFVGVFASYLLTLSRENRRFPWKLFAIAVLIPLLLVAAGLYVAVTRYGYRFITEWPFMVR